MAQDSLPDTSIILLNWNNYEDTSNCIDSIFQKNIPQVSVTVVDNNSTDGSFTKLQKNY
ncbi:MAG: hypothetical protein ABEI86_01105, partial [Halobacteriaceae archaeon]